MTGIGINAHEAGFQVTVQQIARLAEIGIDQLQITVQENTNGYDDARPQ
ncbi:MAG: hypothetical protein ISR52_04575 [Rhodospirillales bacterium]|nr:hypothetical protein [Rhodospirillales bacterium]